VKLHRDTWTVEEAASLLGIGRGLAYRLAAADRLPVLRLGHRMVIPKRALNKLLDSVDEDGGEQEAAS
jgi:excisionase family DNA binding protein